MFFLLYYHMRTCQIPAYNIKIKKIDSLYDYEYKNNKKY